jgi:hypothetical protein
MIFRCRLEDFFSLLHYFLYLHCTENPIYVFPEKELHGLSLNSYILVSVSDKYIPGIGPHIWLQQNRQTYPGNINSLTDMYMSVGIGRQNIIILFCTVSFLGIHKWEPDIYIGFSPALPLQCRFPILQSVLTLFLPAPLI